MLNLINLDSIKRSLNENLFRIYSRIVYRFFPVNHIPLPPLIAWEITGKCNLRCEMCPWYGKQGTPFDTANELTFDEIKDAIQNIKKSYRFRLPYIGLIGGEPTLRKDFVDIIKYLKLNGFKYALTSNFSFYSKRLIGGLAKYPPSDLRVSLDGPEEIHDKIRGVRGAFKNAKRILNELRKKPNGKGIPVRINCTISPMNIDHISELADFVKGLNAHFNIQHLMFLNEKYFKAHNAFFKKVFNQKVPSGASALRLDKKEVSRLINQIKIIKKKFSNRKEMLSFIPNLKIKEIKSYYLDLDNYVYSKKCTYVWAAVRADSKGDIRPCFDYIFGNIKNEKFSKIWNNQKAAYFRKVLKQKGIFPACIRCCKL
jgi:MoaA/NifB/PqqE/SkfB family radical SAM enzyme